jgi:hypothetical protein
MNDASRDEDAIDAAVVALWEHWRLRSGMPELWHACEDATEGDVRAEVT